MVVLQAAHLPLHLLGLTLLLQHRLKAEFDALRHLFVVGLLIARSVHLLAAYGLPLIQILLPQLLGVANMPLHVLDGRLHLIGLQLLGLGLSYELGEPRLKCPNSQDLIDQPLGLAFLVGSALNQLAYPL